MLLFDLGSKLQQLLQGASEILGLWYWRKNYKIRKNYE